jgi:hypothetical protein
MGSGLSEFTCPPPRKPGTYQAFDFVNDTVTFMYCDLISPQFVSSSYVRCLRTFVEPAKTFEYNFKNIYYLPVEKRRFKNIRIELLSNVGNRIALKDNKTPNKVVLHFRRIPNKPCIKDDVNINIVH